MSIKIGSRVYYTSPHKTFENGVVKSITEDGNAAFVVYNCNDDWDNYKDYTGQHTIMEDLQEGWWIDPRDNPLTDDDSWLHDVEMGAR